MNKVQLFAGAALALSILIEPGWTDDHGIGVSDPMVYSEYTMVRMALAAQKQFENLDEKFFAVNATGKLQGGRSSASGLGIDARILPQTNTHQVSSLFNDVSNSVNSSLNLTNGLSNNFNQASSGAAGNLTGAANSTQAASGPNTARGEHAGSNSTTNTTFDSHSFSNLTMPGVNISLTTLGNIGIDSSKLASNGFELSPLDLLSEKMSLFYKFVNLDYLVSVAESEVTNRRHSLLGFDVSIDPKADTKDCLAEVEITLGPFAESSGNDGFEEKYPTRQASHTKVLQLMPRTDTYNVMTVREDVSDVGFAFVFGPLSFGARDRNEDRSFYLVQDIDTVAYVKDGRTFGWRFRPVLGRDFVQPGLRRVYALLSTDTENQQEVIPTRVRTRWVKTTNEHTATESEHLGVNRFQTSFRYTTDSEPLVVPKTATFVKGAQGTDSMMTFQVKDYRGRILEFLVDGWPAKAMEVIPSMVTTKSTRVLPAPPSNVTTPEGMEETTGAVVAAGTEYLSVAENKDTWVRATFNNTFEIKDDSAVWIQTEHGVINSTWAGIVDADPKVTKPKTKVPLTVKLFSGASESTLIVAGDGVADITRVLVDGKSVSAPVAGLPNLYKLNKKASPEAITLLMKDGKTQTFTKSSPLSSTGIIPYGPTK